MIASLKKTKLHDVQNLVINCKSQLVAKQLLKSMLPKIRELEFSIPTLRAMQVKVAGNDVALEETLDFVDEKKRLFLFD